MSKIIASAVLALTLIAGAASANAGYGNALREAAQAGFITPHGVFDGR